MNTHRQCDCGAYYDGASKSDVCPACEAKRPCTAIGPHHGDTCNGGRIQSPNAQFTVQCLACRGTGEVTDTTKPCDDVRADELRLVALGLRHSGDVQSADAIERLLAHIRTLPRLELQGHMTTEKEIRDELQQWDVYATNNGLADEDCRFGITLRTIRAVLARLQPSEREKRLLAVVRGALAISPLWLPRESCQIDPVEGAALAEMHASFREALKESTDAAI